MTLTITRAPARHPSRPRSMGLEVVDALSVLLAAVMTAASLAGLLIDGLYRDNTWSTAAFRGTDIATLAVAVPTLLTALVLGRHGSVGARLVWLGVLAYDVYNYAFYAFGTAFNDAFLLCAAALGLAVALLVFATPRVLPLVAAPGRGHLGELRTVGGYLVVLGAAFGALWTVQSLSYVASGRLPQVITDSGLHTSIVFALDLTLVVPWLVIAGVLLWRRTVPGLALGIVMNTLAVLSMAALATSGAFQQAAGIPDVSWSTPPYLEIGIASLVALALLLPRLRRADPNGAGDVGGERPVSRRTVAAGVAAATGYAALQRLGRTYGSTRAERHRALPGDALCPDPHIVTTHAITIDAPPPRVWPWLVQMGWDRGQWYTARWVDRLLFPANGPSADTLVPEWQQLAVGDRILDGPPKAHTAFVVEQLEPGQHLVLHSTEHLPPGWAEWYGAGIDWTWAFVLDPVEEGRTRFTFRTRVRLRPWWVAAGYWAVMVPADFVMARQMLRGVKTRAEATTAADLARLERPRTDAGHAVAPRPVDMEVS